MNGMIEWLVEHMSDNGDKVGAVVDRCTIRFAEEGCRILDTVVVRTVISISIDLSGIPVEGDMFDNRIAWGSACIVIP